MNNAESEAAVIYNLLPKIPAKAWKEARRALKIYPQNERIQFVAGLALIAVGNKAQARKHFANAIKLGTGTPDAYVNLALLSAELGQSDFALDTLNRAELRFPGDMQVMMTRVHVHRAAGDPKRALDAVGAVLAADPKAAEAATLKAVLQSENGRLLEAIATLETLLDDHPDHVPALFNLGRFYAFSNQSDRALAVTERAHAIAPDNPAVIENLAIRYREAGAFDAALDLFRRLTNLAPQSLPMALRQLSDIVPDCNLTPLRLEVERVLKTAHPGDDRGQLAFARAAIARREGDSKAYVRSLKDANRQMASFRRYEAKLDTRFHRFVQDHFRQENSPAPAGPALPARPVFILGLPRSGTTLLERMLCRSPDVAGLGEVALLNRYVWQRFQTDTAFAAGAEDLRTDYAGFQRLAGPTKWTVDKMPANYIHIGWINRIFPEARVILLRRDRRDVALSLYENYFDDPGQNFTFDERSIAQRLSLFEETVDAWQDLGADYLQVTYEDLVTLPEPSLRKIADYCGIPYDPAMLRPGDDKGAIRTASSVQARRDVNRASIGRWKAVPDLLPGLFR